MIEDSEHPFDSSRSEMEIFSQVSGGLVWLMRAIELIAWVQYVAINNTYVVFN